MQKYKMAESSYSDEIMKLKNDAKVQKRTND